MLVVVGPGVVVRQLSSCPHPGRDCARFPHPGDHRPPLGLWFPAEIPEWVSAFDPSEIWGLAGWVVAWG